LDDIALFYWHVQNQRLLTQHNYVTRPFQIEYALNNGAYQSTTKLIH